MRYSVPEGETRIDELAFAGSDGLESVFIPDSVRSIGNYAFMNCYSLREIRLPERIDSMGAGLFQNCWQLRSVRLPEGTITLGSDMFMNCHALAEIYMPSTLKDAGRTSLSGCRNLRRIYIDPSQLGILPVSARHTAALTFMEANADACGAEGSEAIDLYAADKQKSLLDLAVNRKNTEAVRYMIGHGLLTEDAVREYIQKSASHNRVEITALLLDSLAGLKGDSGAVTTGMDADPFG